MHTHPPAAPSSAPTEGVGSALSSTVVTFHWNVPLPVDQNGVLKYYKAFVSEVPTGRNWSLIAVDTQISLASLHPYYKYSCRVAAYTVGFGPFSQPFYAVTDEECKLIF